MTSLPKLGDPPKKGSKKKVTRQRVAAGLTSVEWFRVPKGPVVVQIKPEPKAANVQLRQHWRVHRRYRDTLTALFVAKKVPKLKGRVEITHDWSLAYRVRDEDSFGLAIKIVLDSLVRAGVIADDDPTHVKLVFGGQQAGGEGSLTRRGLLLVLKEIR